MVSTVEKRAHDRKLSALRGENRRSFIDPTTYTLEDADRLEGCFPGCSAALDMNPRVCQWQGYRFSVRDNHYIPEDDQAAVLVALRTSSAGCYFMTRADTLVGSGTRHFVERAIFVPSLERWVVIR